jgi:RNA polymerase subunit RPABC4/transcription elongation factor Spt4
MLDFLVLVKEYRVEKLEECPECGSAELTLGSAELTANLVGAFDKTGMPSELFTPRELQFTVRAWKCEHCEFVVPDRDEIEQFVIAETKRMQVEMN